MLKSQTHSLKSPGADEDCNNDWIPIRSAAIYDLCAHLAVQQAYQEREFNNSFFCQINVLIV